MRRNLNQANLNEDISERLKAFSEDQKVAKKEILSELKDIKTLLEKR